MIEKIKKEIELAEESGQPYVYNEVLKVILDKYNNQDKYKNAWKDMHKWFSQRNSKYDTPKSLEIENFVSTFMQELEKKHNIGGVE